MSALVPAVLIASDLAVSTKLLVFAVVEYLLNSPLNAPDNPDVGVKLLSLLSALVPAVLIASDLAVAIQLLVSADFEYSLNLVLSAPANPDVGV